MDHSYGIQFISSKFDFESTLPEEYNAGNRCYGRDVAEFIATSLTAHLISKKPQPTEEQAHVVSHPTASM